MRKLRVEEDKKEAKKKDIHNSKATLASYDTSQEMTAKLNDSSM